MNRLIKKIVAFVFQLCYLYAEHINTIADYVFKPISKFLSYYSQSLSSSIDNINKVLSGLLIYFPVFAVSFIAVSVLFNISLFNEYSTEFARYQSLIAFILLVSSFVSVYVSRSVIGNKWTDTVYSSGALFCSSVLVVYYDNPPYSYFILLLVIYSIGAYSQTKIDFERPVRQSYIYDELESHFMILTASIASVFIIPVVLFAEYHINNYFNLKSIQFALCLLMYAITIYQETQYEYIYSGIDIDTSSRFWILTPRIGVVSGSILILHSEIQSIYGAPLMALPFVFGCLFYIYFEYMTNRNMGDIVFRGSEEGMYSNNRDTVLNNVSIESTSERKTSTLSLKLDVEVNDKVRDLSGENLAESVVILSHIEDILLDSNRNKSVAYERLEDFYNTQIDHIINEELDIDELPRDIKHRVITRMSEKGEITNQEIQDINMRNR